MEKDLMTKADLMKYLSISKTTVDRLMKAGLPYVKLDPARRGSVRFKRQDIDKWLETKRIK